MVDPQSPPPSKMRLVASLQCFARFTDDPAIGARQETPVTIHAISLERITMQTVADLRIGAIVRLRLPAIGWRHVAIAWVGGAKAGCDILFPLLPHELRATLRSGKPRRGDTSPPRKGKPILTIAPRAARTATHPRQHSPRGGRSPLLPDILIPGRAAIAAMMQTILGPSPATLGTA